VICGLGRKGLLLSQQFRKRGERVVVIDQNGQNPLIGQCSEYGTTCIIGNAADRGLLRKARVHKAKYVISVCGNDGANAEVAVHTRDLVRDRKGTALLCLVHIIDLQLCNLLREREIAMGKVDAFRLGLFNVFESGARILLDQHPPFSITGNDPVKRPHIVVVGAGRMGESLIANAARRWRDMDDRGTEKLRITMIDSEAENKKKSLCYRYTHLEQYCDLVPVQLFIEGPDYERADFLFDHNEQCDIVTVYICLDNDSRAVLAALKIRRRLGSLPVPIVVRMTHDAGLAGLLHAEKDTRDSFAHMHAFGLLDRTCTPDLIIGCTYEILARAIHDDYVHYEKQKGTTIESNPSMASWEELPENLKESNRSQAEHICVKLKAIACDIGLTSDWDVQPFTFSPDEVELMAQMEHERYIDERLRTGWRYGPIKDLPNKTNPTLVSWNELSEEEKDKDRNNVRGLPSFLANAGFHVYRFDT